MQFRQVAGQNFLKQKLAQMHRQQKLPHAMMLAGAEGTGGLPLALALAQFIFCENKTETDSCGKCPACVKADKWIHPDIHYTFPTISKGDSPPLSNDFISEWRQALASNPYMNVTEWLQQLSDENKLGNITARECKEIIHRTTLKSFESDSKVHIIWMAEYLRETGNILLKTFEEPPAGNYFILIVENTEQVLTTILSRVQLFKLPRLEDNDIAEALRERFDVAHEQALQIARVADGSFNEALQMAHGGDDEPAKRITEWFSCCLRLKTPDRDTARRFFQWIETTAATTREQQKLFLKYAQFFVRECQLLKAGSGQHRLSDAELQMARELLPRLDYEQLQQLHNLLSRLFMLIERNAHAKIQFTAFSYRIAALLQGEPVAQDLPL